MKYMTKEWYETMQKTFFHLLLKVSKNAESFSEDYFRDLYKHEEEKWLKFMTELSSEQREPSDEKPEFNLEEGKKRFRQMLRSEVKDLKRMLPESILRRVADIRVLALHYASREVKQEITRFCKRNEKSVHAAMAAYQKQYAKQFKNGAPAFAEKLLLHDCKVLSCRKSGKDVVITLDPGGGLTEIRKIRIKNCTVLKQDAPLHGAWCLYEEIYKTGETYEIHFLLSKKKLIDYIVAADALEFQYA